VQLDASQIKVGHEKSNEEGMEVPTTPEQCKETMEKIN